MSGKNDTTQIMIAVLTRISWVLSKNLGPRKPKCEFVCVQVIYSEETTKKKKMALIGSEPQRLSVYRDLPMDRRGLLSPLR